MPGFMPGIHVFLPGLKTWMAGTSPAMTGSEMIRVTDKISIDDSELEESFVRASGPGGQNVNKVSSAVQLRFDARRSRALPNDVAIRLMKLAGSRLTKDGVIVIVAQTHRDQIRNRAEARERLVEMIQEAAVKPEVRRATKPTKASKQRRVEGKKHRGQIKNLRRAKPGYD
jgi:ribosome-associated protein